MCGVNDAVEPVSALTASVWMITGWKIRRDDETRREIKVYFNRK